MNFTHLLLTTLFPDAVDFILINNEYQTEVELCDSSLIYKNLDFREEFILKTKEHEIQLEPITEEQDILAGMSELTHNVYFFVKTY